MTQLSELSGNLIHRLLIPVPMAAAGTDDEYPFLTADSNLTFVSAIWTPLAAVTANGTNFSILSIRNRGAAAAGTALPATRSYAATNSAAFVKETMTNSSTAADLLITSGDVLTLQRLHTASGVVIPAGLVEMAYRRR